MRVSSGEFVVLLFFLGCITALVIRTVEWLWWKPKKLEKLLRSQGIKGTPYKVLFGDLRYMVKLLKEAGSKPIIPFSNDIVQRVTPFFSHLVEDCGGKLCYSWSGTSPRVVVTDPELAREILGDRFGHVDKVEKIPTGRYLTAGLTSHRGQKWAHHRKIVNPAFHTDRLKGMFPAFSCCCSELVDRWKGLIGGTGESIELDVWPELESLTGDIISRAAFGSSYMEGRRIFQLQTEQAELFVQAVRSIYIPGFKFLPTRNNRRRKEINNEVCGLLRGIIKKREESMGRGTCCGDDLLGLLMESNADQGTTGMTTDEVIEECKLFYIVGQESTSVLLNWTMVVLSVYPKWQDLAREEVLRIFGKNKPDFGGFNHLKIVTAILNEVLRLYPPGPFLNRKTYHRTNLGEYSFPSGIEFQVPILMMHHDPRLWGDDVNEFKPERFSEGVSKATNNQMSFFPFGYGPRVCIGQSFAMMEAKLGLAMILQHFKFKLSPSYVHAPYSVLTLHPQHGAQLVLTAIN